MYSHINEETGLGFPFNRTLEDSQFQPPIESFNTPGDISQIDPVLIDQKIMQNIQKYLSNYMAPQPQPAFIQPPPTFQQVQQQQQQLPPQQDYQQLVSDFQKTSLSTSQRLNDTLASSILPQQNFQQQPQTFTQQYSIASSQQPTNTFTQQQQINTRPSTAINHQYQPSPVQDNQSISSEEFTVLKQVIEGLNRKIDSMQKLTENLQLTIDSKDREISKIRSIYSLRGQKSEIREAVKQKVKRDKGIQTVINLVDNRQEYETFSYLYDKDQDLIRSEKGSLLKYLRKEVIQNQEFLDRINELELENMQLQEELQIYHNKLAQTNMIIQENMESQQIAEEEVRKRQVEVGLECDILNSQDFQGLEIQVQQLTEQVYQEQQTVKQLEQDIQTKQDELDSVQDSTNHSLYQENSHLKKQLQQKSYDYESLTDQFSSLSQDHQSLTDQLDQLQQLTQEKERNYQDQLQKLKSSHLQQVDKVNQEKDRLQKQLSEKDKQVWDLQAKIEEHKKLILELEAQLDKKKKKKKGPECMECFKKEAEIQTLTAKLLKLTQEGSAMVSDLEKQVKQKQAQIQDSQSLIQTLTLQLQENISKGGDDPNVKIHIQKLQKDNEEKSKLIDQLKTNMEKQAAQFMMQLIQQQSK